MDLENLNDFDVKEDLVDNLLLVDKAAILERESLVHFLSEKVFPDPNADPYINDNEYLIRRGIEVTDTLIQYSLLEICVSNGKFFDNIIEASEKVCKRSFLYNELRLHDEYFNWPLFSECKFEKAKEMFDSLDEYIAQMKEEFMKAYFPFSTIETLDEASLKINKILNIIITGKTDANGSDLRAACSINSLLDNCRIRKQ